MVLTCPKCHIRFHAQSVGITNSKRVKLKGNEGCPNCYSTVPFPEGTFDFDENGNIVGSEEEKRVEAAMETAERARYKKQIFAFLDRPAFTKDILIRLQTELQVATQRIAQLEVTAEEQQITIAEIKARAIAVTPELSGLVKFAPKDFSDFMAFLEVMLIIVGILLSQLNQDKPSTTVINNYNTYNTAPVDTKPVRQPNGEAATDALCQCGSGLKFIDCHGCYVPPANTTEAKQ